MCNKWQEYHTNVFTNNVSGIGQYKTAIQNSGNRILVKKL